MADNKVEKIKEILIKLDIRSKYDGGMLDEDIEPSQIKEVTITYYNRGEGDDWEATIPFKIADLDKLPQLEIEQKLIDKIAEAYIVSGKDFGKVVRRLLTEAGYRLPAGKAPLLSMREIEGILIDAAPYGFNWGDMTKGEEERYRIIRQAQNDAAYKFYGGKE